MRKFRIIQMKNFIRSQTILAVKGEYGQYQLQMMKGAKYYLQRSSEMEPNTVLKYLETMLKVIMDKLVLAI
jgi:hypothetical protein